MAGSLCCLLQISKIAMKLIPMLVIHWTCLDLTKLFCHFCSNLQIHIPYRHHDVSDESIFAIVLSFCTNFVVCLIPWRMLLGCPCLSSDNLMFSFWIFYGHFDDMISCLNYTDSRRIWCFTALSPSGLLEWIYCEKKRFCPKILPGTTLKGKPLSLCSQLAPVLYHRNTCMCI